MSNQTRQPVALRAGAAMVDITPPAGTHLGGTWGTLRTAQTIAEPLFAKALVFESGGKKIGFLQADLEIVMGRYTRQIREAAAQSCGIAPDALMVHLPQPHSTPPLGHFIIDDDFDLIPPEHEYLRGSQEAYCDWAVQKMIEAVQLAHADLQAAQIACGSGLRDDLAFNRRGVTRDGSVIMPWLYSSQQQPLGPTNIRYLEGPMDPEVGVFCVRDQSMRMRAMMLHYTCHPVNVFARHHHVVSPDWPGTWASAMQERHGQACVPLVLNGCCGNINPWPAFVADFQADHRRMGRELASTAGKVIDTLIFEEQAAIDFRVRHIHLPIKQAKPQDLEAAQKLLKDYPQVVWQKENPSQADWEWMDAAMLMSVELERRRSPVYDYEIQVLRVGPAAFVGLPGEPFVEGQLAIKIGSPAYPTYVAHGTTDYAGYIAPRQAYQRGGHEIRTKPAKWAKLEPGALETIVEQSVELLKEIFAANAPGH